MFLLLVFVLSHSRLIPNTSKDRGLYLVTSNTGEVSDYYFSFITDQAFESGNYLKIVFPSQYSDVGLGSNDCYIDSVLVSCEQEGTNTVSVTIDENLSANTRYSLRVSGIVNPSEGTTSYFELYVQSSESDQVFDINDAFVTIFITPSPATATGTVTFSSNVVGESSEMIVAATLTTSLTAGSVFQISLPDDFSFESTECEVQAYSDSVEAVSGDFYCEESYGFMNVYGLSQDLGVGQGVSFLFYVVNPGFVMAEGDGDIVFRTCVLDSSDVIDLATIDSPEIVAGTFTSPSLSLYSSYTKFVENDLVYVTITFKTSHKIEEGGSIIIDYQTTILDLCLVTQGITSSTYSQCSVSSTTSTITSFSEISAGTSITIINQIEVSSVASLTITSYDSNSNIIDTDDSLSITLDTATKLTSLSFASTIDSSRKGSFTLTITSASYTSKDIKIYLPSSIKASGSIACTSSTPTSLTLSCSYSNNIVTISSATIDCSTSCDLIIDTSTSGNWQFPSAQSSSVNIYEVSVLIDSSFATVVADIEKSEFSDKSLMIVTESGVFSPLLVSVTLSNGLDGSLSPYFELEFDGFDADLGTGLADTEDIGCLTTLTVVEGGSITCVLLTSSGTFIRVEGFDSVSAGSEVSLSFVVKTGTGSAIVKVSAGIVQYNELVTITDESEFSISFSAVAVDWTEITSADTEVTTIYTETSLSMTLKPSITSVDNDMLFVIFPVGWDLTGSTATLSTTSLTVTAFNNEYAPGLLIYLSTKTLSSTSSTTIDLTLTNGKYTGAGSGQIYVALVKTLDWSVQNYAALDDGTSDITFSGSTSGIFAYSDFDLSNQKRANGDILYRFFITVNHTIPSSGSIEITFPVGTDISNAYCLFSSSFSSSTICTVSSQKLLITGFDELAELTATYIKVFNIINPDADTTDTITIKSIYTSGGTDYIDVSTLDSLELEAQGYTSNTTFEYYSVYPGSMSNFGQLYLNVYMDTSVPKGGALTITFPDTVSLPSISESNCFFNLKFKSCTSSSTTITIEPVDTFPAGISMNLMVHGASISGNSTYPVSVTSTYAGLTLSETADDDSSAYFITYSNTQSTFVGDLSVIPTNVAESALYNFTIPSSIEDTDELVIWFPDSFPVNLGQVHCESSASSRIDEIADCSVFEYKGVKVTGLSGSDFYLNLYSVNNPGTEGDSGTILMQIIDSDGLVKAYGNYDFTVTGLPSGIRIRGILLEDYNVNEVTDYTFIVEYSELPSEIWVDLPREFNNEAFGIGDTYQCSTSLVDSDFLNDQDWATSVTCGNYLYNRISLQIQSSGSSSGTYLKFVISGLKSPSIVGRSNYFSVYLLSSSSTLISKTYEYDGNSRVTYTISKQSFVISNSQSQFRMAPGVSQTYNIYTTSSKILAKEDITFTYSIISKNPTDGISISPSSISLQKGDSNVSFQIKVSSSVSEGNFIIKWESSSLNYLSPKWSLLVIDSAVTYSISVKNIPELIKGYTTVPITVYSPASPESKLKLVPTANSGFTFTEISWSQGEFDTTYTITVDSTVSGGSYSVDFELEGDNSQYFKLDFNSVIVIVADYDTTSPAIVSFVVRSPRHKTYIDMALQTSESCTFYYNVGPRGTRPPTNSSLINNANTVDGYYLGYVGASYTYSFQITGLQGEYDYVLYGLLKDTVGNYISEIFTINLFTEDMDDSIYFTLGFAEPYPTVAQMKGSVVSALSYQFVTESSRIIYQSSTESTATYKLESTVYNDYPSPINIIRYTAINTEINSILVGVQLDTEFDIDDSIVVIDNKRPTWMVYPEVNITTKDSVIVEFALEESATIFIEIIADNDTVPSSRQVVNKLDAYGDPAGNAHEKDVEGGVYLNITISGLTPTSSYTLVMSAKNSKDPIRYMDDELLAVIDFITQAGTISSGNETSSFSLFLAIQFITLLV